MANRSGRERIIDVVAGGEELLEFLVEQERCRDAKTKQHFANETCVGREKRSFARYKDKRFYETVNLFVLQKLETWLALQILASQNETIFSPHP